MAVTKKLNFNKRQLAQFARLLRAARLEAKLSQMAVANLAFEYKISHCKVSRVERAAMPLVDAVCIERMAHVLGVPRDKLVRIDPRFSARTTVIQVATNEFWRQQALLQNPKGRITKRVSHRAAA